MYMSPRAQHVRGVVGPRGQHNAAVPGHGVPGVGPRAVAALGRVGRQRAAAPAHLPAARAAHACRILSVRHTDTVATTHHLPTAPVSIFTTKITFASFECLNSTQRRLLYTHTLLTPEPTA